MAWAATDKVVLGCVAFLVWWVLAVFPAVPFLPIGRTAGSLLGAVLMVVFQVISTNDAFAAVDLQILGLLFGTMVVSIYLERADLFKYLGKALSWRSWGGKDLLCRLCLLSAISSALFTNDTTCVILTEFVLKLCREKKLPPQPFLIALACSANIGSATTPIGNPQNLVIAVQSKIGFGSFLVGILPAVVVGLVVNTLGLLLLYWRRLSNSAVEDEREAKDDPSVNAAGGDRREQPERPNVGSFSEDVELPRMLEKKRGEIDRRNSDSLVVELANYYRTGRGGVEVQQDSGLSPVRGSVLSDVLGLEPRVSSSPYPHSHQQTRSNEGGILNQIVTDALPSNAPQSAVVRQQRRRRIWKVCVYLVTVGMLGALLAGLNLPWTAITAAVTLMVLDFSDAGPCLDQVSYSLLVFFAGMFITVAGFNATGAPGQLWSAVEAHAHINSASGLSILAIVVTVLSNVASNVPTVLLLGPRVAASAAATPGASVSKAWLILAWVSTVAGNLTLVGSAANLIVSEQARRSPLLSYKLSFWNHLRFGVPATLIVIAVGLPLIRG
ncbi:hypothetical protein CY35_01G074700 [Sphagnum magellanicum]|nr:hypothetical protein CY35_01G074700 [Sphagnum magellanicum]